MVVVETNSLSVLAGLREIEVNHLRLPCLGDHDVARLEIARNHATSVRRSEHMGVLQTSPPRPAPSSWINAYRLSILPVDDALDRHPAGVLDQT